MAFSLLFVWTATFVASSFPLSLQGVISVHPTPYKLM
jgi:hypothetical protein